MSRRYTIHQILAASADPTLAPQWMRVDMASAVAGVSDRTLRRWAAAGLVRITRPSTRVTLYDRDSILALLAARENRNEVPHHENRDEVAPRK